MPFTEARTKAGIKGPSASVLILFVSAMLCACRAASFSTTSSSDAFVATGPGGNLSTNNYGGGGALAVAASSLPLGEFQTVLRFDLSGARSSFDTQYGAGQWTAQSVTLQLSASPHNNAIYNEIAAGQFNVSLMQNNSWVEGTGTAGLPATNGLSFESLQGVFINAITDQALGTFSFGGGSGGANGYQLGMTSSLITDLVAGNDLSLRLFAADSNVSYLFSSRVNASSANRPTLIITAVPEPGSLALFAIGLAGLSLRRYGNHVRKFLINRTLKPIDL